MATLEADQVMSWRYRAACIGQPIDIFFPERGRRDQVSHAKSICVGCEVRWDCLDFAMSFDEGKLPGIYGGTTEGDRRRMRYSRHTG